MPSTPKPNEYKGFKDRLCKHFTLLIFFCLPRRVTSLFVELSISILLLKLRDSQFTDFIQTEKLNQLLGRNYDNNFVALPEYTVKWFWTENYLNEEISLRTGTVTVKEALVNDDILKQNYDAMASRLIDNLPYLIKLKLNLFKGKGRMTLKHRLMSLFHSEVSIA